MLSRAERGERTPSLETLAKVCFGLSLSVADFFQPTLQYPLSGMPTEATQSAGRSPAEEHLLDAMRSLEQGIAALRSGTSRRGRVRKESKPVLP